MNSLKVAGLTPGSSATASFLDGGMVLILMVICGLSVGNVYFNQPLLADMGRTFNLTVQQVGWIPTATQVGYATGLLFLAPLGDRLERRKLIVTMMVLIASTDSWVNWQWSGVCGLGCLLLSIAAIAHFGKGKLLSQKVS